MSFQGNPCWYELATSDLSGAGAFYEMILGWKIGDSGMPGFDYRLASVGKAMVAGLMAMPEDAAAMPPFWLIYFAVDDCDRFCVEAVAAGASIHREPADIPGTGRFAILADPQGVGFGILQPDLTPEDRARAEAGEGAFDQCKAGHGNWNELMSPDPGAAFDFYARHFGWTKGEAMPMGGTAVYQLIRRNGRDIGAIQPHVDAPSPAWLPYFGVDGSVAARIAAIKAAGGQVHFGPAEVPGPAFIAIGEDPQGAAFAIVGPEE